MRPRAKNPLHIQSSFPAIDIFYLSKPLFFFKSMCYVYEILQRLEKYKLTRTHSLTDTISYLRITNV